MGKSPKVLTMNTFLTVLAVAAVAAADGNVVPVDQDPLQGTLLVRLDGLQLENINLKKVAGEPVIGLPRTTDNCDETSGLACFEDIGEVVIECTWTNFEEIVSCVQDAIGEDHECWPCVCWLIEYMLGDGYCD